MHVKAAGIDKEVTVKEHSKPPHIYGLPKIHKKDTPLRPVVSCIGTALHLLAKHLVRILNPLQNNIEYNIKNSSDFIDRIKDLKVSRNTQLISLDVTNLFTSVPIDKALNVLRAALEVDQSLGNRTPLTIDQIVELTSFCVNNTVFQFKTCFFKQADGMAMGSTLSPVLCNLYMDEGVVD